VRNRRSRVRGVAAEILAFLLRIDRVSFKEDPMRLFRENVVPVAFLALWVAASGYTLYALKGLEALRGVPVEATIELTVRPKLAATSAEVGR
jgi:hypothetical protein